jgi:beta-lactamase class C
LRDFLEKGQAVDEPIPQPIERFIQKLEKEKAALQGGALAILSGGRVSYQTTFGYQRALEGPITPQTLFPLASVSKPITAMLIGLLQQKKILTFDAEWKVNPLKHPVTLRHLLSHTSGYPFSGNRYIERWMPRPKILQVLEKQKPISKPGESYFYSNMFFSLVEDILQLKERTFKGELAHLRKLLGIEGLQVVPLDPSFEVAYPHRKKRTLRFPAAYPKVVPSAGGVFASLDAMIEILKVQSGHRPDLLSPDIIQQMTTPQITTEDIKEWGLEWPYPCENLETYSALGWRILRLKTHPEKAMVSHSGCLAGISTFVGFIPSQDVGIIILINEETKLALQTGIDFWAAFQ